VARNMCGNPSLLSSSLGLIGEDMEQPCAIPRRQRSFGFDCQKRPVGVVIPVQDTLPERFGAADGEIMPQIGKRQKSSLDNDRVARAPTGSGTLVILVNNYGWCSYSLWLASLVLTASGI